MEEMEGWKDGRMEDRLFPFFHPSNLPTKPFQSAIANHQSSIINHQSSIINYQLSIINPKEGSLHNGYNSTDSDSTEKTDPKSI